MEVRQGPNVGCSAKGKKKDIYMSNIEQTSAGVTPSRLVFRRHWVLISNGIPAILIRWFRVFPQSFHSCVGTLPRLDHDRLLPNPVHLMMANSWAETYNVRIEGTEA
jgi:hypothetical protein